MCLSLCSITGIYLLHLRNFKYWVHFFIGKNKVFFIKLRPMKRSFNKRGEQYVSDYSPFNLDLVNKHMNKLGLIFHSFLWKARPYLASPFPKIKIIELLAWVYLYLKRKTLTSENCFNICCRLHSFAKHFLNVYVWSWVIGTRNVKYWTKVDTVLSSESC